jgi:hypothetical protein
MNDRGQLKYLYNTHGPIIDGQNAYVALYVIMHWGSCFLAYATT